VLKDSGTEVVLSGIQMLRMNAIMERWVLTCRRELLDRTLIWNQRHLRHALREFEQFYNEHSPHQGIAKRPATIRTGPRPSPIQMPTHSSASAGATVSAASSTSISMSPDQHGCNYRQGQGSLAPVNADAAKAKESQDDPWPVTAKELTDGTTRLEEVSQTLVTERWAAADGPAP